MRENIFEKLNKIKKDIKFTRRRFNRVRKEKICYVFLIILFIILFWKINLTAAIFWNLFFTFLFFKYDSRYIAAMALMSLASCPFLLIFEKETMAEQVAIYAYYFLVMTVVLQIVEYRRETKKEKIENSKNNL